MENKNLSGIKLVEVRVRNFRSLKSVDVKLDDYTIIVGENNAGKSNFIDAISIGIGYEMPNYDIEDIFIGKDESNIDRDRTVIIDLLFRPIDKNGELVNDFSSDYNWIYVWKRNIYTYQNKNRFVGIRTEIKWDKTEKKLKLEKKFLKKWNEDSSDIISTPCGDRVLRDQIEHVALYSVKANRDINNDIKGSNNPWRRITSNLDISADKIKKFEDSFNEFNNHLSESSQILGNIEKSFNDLSYFISSERGSVTIKGVPQNIDELSKRIGLNFATKGSHSFPMEFHGSGTRSITTVLLFKIFFEFQRNLDKNQIYHPIIAVEEPESHLHPQAAIALFDYIDSMEGQRIITTHSSNMIKECDIYSLRRFVRNGDETQVLSLDRKINPLSDEDKLIIERKVTKSHGEILFSRLIILYEGEETEDQVLPIFFKKYFGRHHSFYGISMISAKGYNYSPFILFANSFKIPFYIFSDGEDTVKTAISKNIAKLGLDLSDQRIVMIPNMQNFEKYISTEDYREVLTKVITDIRIKHDKQSNGDNERRKQELRETWKNKTLDDIAKELKDKKTIYAEPIARSICNMEDRKLQIPSLIMQLFNKIASDIGITNLGEMNE